MLTMRVSAYHEVLKRAWGIASFMGCRVLHGMSYLAVGLTLLAVLVKPGRAQVELQPAAFLPLIERHGPLVGAFNPWS